MAPDRVSTLIVACCILLNLGVNLREPEPENCDMDGEGCAADLHIRYHGRETGNAVKEHAAHNLFKIWKCAQSYMINALFFHDSWKSLMMTILFF